MKNKGLKFRVGSEKHSELIQEQLFKLGGRWAAGGDSYRYTNRLFLFLNDDNTICYVDSVSYFENAEEELCTLDELFLREKATETIKLTEDYNAVVSRDNIVVGCQTIPFDKLEQVYKKALEFRL